MMSDNARSYIIGCIDGCLWHINKYIAKEDKPTKEDVDVNLDRKNIILRNLKRVRDTLEDCTKDMKGEEYAFWRYMWITVGDMLYFFYVFGEIPSLCMLGIAGDMLSNYNDMLNRRLVFGEM